MGENNVVFQSFWTLTANSKSRRSGGKLLTLPSMLDLAAKYNVSVEVLFFRFLIGEGVVPLTGTCSLGHMSDDLAARSVPLAAADAEKIANMMQAQVAEVEVSESS